MQGLQRYKCLIAGIVGIGVLNSPVYAALETPISTEKVKQLIHLPFVKNIGQYPSQVSYTASSLNGAVFVETNGDLTYVLPRKSADKFESWAFRERFISTETLTPVVAKSANTKISVQFEKQIEDVPSATTLTMGEIAPGIRLSLQATDNNVEKIFLVAPGTKPNAIKVKLDGVDGSHVGADGRLVLHTALGSISFTKPVAYQINGSQKQIVDVAYSLKDNVYGFAVGIYDETRELVIDPLLASTFVGGNGGYPTYSYDTVTSLIPAGDYLYAAGGTHSPNFPTALGYDQTFDGIRQGFILRFTSDLSTLVNATFIGGNVSDIAMAADGQIVAAGQAYSGFPKTSNAYSYPSAYEQTGGFMAKFSADLTQLVAAGVVVPAYSINRIAFGNGGIYFVGRHNANNLATTPGVISSACYCTTNGSFGQAPYDGFLGKISTDLSSLQILSWIGGDNPSDIAVAADSSVYVTDTAYTISDGNIRQIDADVTTVLASASFSYLGNEQTTFNNMSLGDNSVVVAGTTRKNNLPVTSGAFDTSCGSNGNCDNTDPDFYIPKTDGFVAKYSTDLQTIQALTYFGGKGNDTITAIDADAAGNIIISGGTDSNDLSTSSNAYKKTGDRAYIAKLSNNLSSLQYGSYFAAAAVDLESDTNGVVYIGGGVSETANLPTTSGAFDTTYNGDATDGFISKFDTGNGTTPPPSTNVAPTADAGVDQTVAQQTNVRLDGSRSTDSDGTIVSYSWKQTAGKSVTLKSANSAVASFIAPKTRRGTTLFLTFELTVTDNLGASSSDQVVITVTP